MKRSDE